MIEIVDFGNCPLRGEGINFTDKHLFVCVEDKWLLIEHIIDASGSDEGIHVLDTQKHRLAYDCKIIRDGGVVGDKKVGGQDQFLNIGVGGYINKTLVKGPIQTI